MRPLLLGFLGGLAAIVLAAAIAGVALWRYQSGAPDRDRAALVAEIDAYDAWYRENTYRRNLGDAYYLPYRDSFIEQHPTLKQYILWWQDRERAKPENRNMYASAYIDALPPDRLRDPSAIDAYIAR